MLINSQDISPSHFLFPGPTCVQCLITIARELNAAHLNAIDQDKEGKHSILTPAQSTSTPRLGSVSLAGLTRGQPIKPLVIKLQELNVFFFPLECDGI